MRAYRAGSEAGLLDALDAAVGTENVEDDFALADVLFKIADVQHVAGRVDRDRLVALEPEGLLVPDEDLLRGRLLRLEVDLRVVRVEDLGKSRFSRADRDLDRVVEEDDVVEVVLRVGGV